MKNIIFLGLVSFFSDLSSEMVYSLIPIYLTSVLGACLSTIAALILLLFLDRKNGAEIEN